MSNWEPNWFREFRTRFQDKEYKAGIFIFIITFFITIFVPIWVPEVFHFTVENGVVKIEYTAILARILTSCIFAFISGFIAWLITRFPNSLDEFRNNISNSLDEFKNDISTSYYRGFSTLLSGELKESFEKLEKSFENASTSSVRAILLDFIVNSLSRLGKTGFVMVDASVSDYVKYISETVRKAEKVVMTCVVRPYWFITDRIQDVSLPPYENDKNKYGKGEHLRFFEKRGNDEWAQRWLIVDENMLAEIFLTAYIDKYFYEKNSCVICQKYNHCPFHKNRKKPSELFGVNSLDDIPEIFWFKKNVNEERSVNLIYTLVKKRLRDGSRIYEELDDRIYISVPSKLDIRFNFINLERGILRIRWGEWNPIEGTGAEPLAWIKDLSSPNELSYQYKINPITGGYKEKGHKFYKSFKDILVRIEYLNDQEKKDFKEEIQGRLSTLQGEIKIKFDRIELFDIPKIIAQEIDNIINTVSTNINGNLIKAYDDLVDFYNNNSIPEVAFVVVQDSHHPDYPIRKASWKTNWEGIKNAPG